MPKAKFVEVWADEPRRFAHAVAWLLLSATQYEDGKVERSALARYLSDWSSRVHYVLKDAQGGLIAAASVQPDTSPLYVAHFAVQRHMRRQGYARQLMQGIAERATVPTLQLNAPSDSARDAFSRIGFVPNALNGYMEAPVAALLPNAASEMPAANGTPQPPQSNE